MNPLAVVVAAGAVIVVVVVAFWALKPNQRSPGHISPRTLRKQYRVTYGEDPDFEGEYIRKQRERRRRRWGGS